MKGNRLIFVLCSLLYVFSLPVGAQKIQKEIDSLKDILGEAVPVRVEAEIAGRLADKYLLSNLKESLRYAYIAFEAAKKTGDPRLINKTLMTIGNVYSFGNTYSIAMEYYQQILDNHDLCSCPGIEGEAHMYLGQDFNYMGRPSKALYHLLRADTLLRLAGKEKAQHINNLFIAEAFMKEHQYSKALQVLQRALQWITAQRDTSALINSFFVLSNIYRNNGDLSREREILTELLSLARKRRNIRAACKAENRLAENALLRHDLKEAFRYLKKVKTCLEKENMQALQQKNLDLWAEYYGQIGHYEQAIALKDLSQQLDDSIRQAHLREVRELLDIRYNTESKFRSLELLKQDNHIRELIFKRNLFYKNISRLLLLFFGLIFLILLIIFFVRYRAHRHLLETNRQLEKVHVELARKQEQMNKENQVRNKLFMILAHDLLNPFNALLGFAELLSEEIHNFERRDIKRHAEFIFQAAKQLHFLLENLLQWARIQTGRVSYQPAYFELHKLIRDVTEMYRYMAEKKKITLMDNHPDDLIVYADETLISVVLRNLVHNAIKYTGETGVVTLEAFSQGDHVTVTVSDTGCGMTQEEQEKLFNLEYHFSRKGTSGEEGTGLGLIISKEFLEIHGSSLTLESRPGEGSRFSFSLRKKK